MKPAPVFTWLVLTCLIFWLFYMPCSYWQETTEFTPESHFLTVLCALQLLAGDNRIHPPESHFDCFTCLAVIGRRQHNSPPTPVVWFWLFYVPCSYWQETTEFTPESHFDCFTCLAAIGRRQHNSPPTPVVWFWLFYVPCSYWQETTEFTPESHFDCFTCLAAIGRRQHNSPPTPVVWFWLFYVPCSYWQETTEFTPESRVEMYEHTKATKEKQESKEYVNHSSLISLCPSYKYF